MTDINENSPTQELEAKRAELTGKITNLVDENNEIGITNLLEDELKLNNLPFPQSGQTIGLNYNIDEYFVDLPNGMVVNYGIGGSASTYIEHVNIMTRKEANQKQKVMDWTDEVNNLAIKAVNDGNPGDRKIALGSIKDLEQQVVLIREWLEKSVNADKAGK